MKNLSLIVMIVFLVGFSTQGTCSQVMEPRSIKTINIEQIKVNTTIVADTENNKY